MVDQDPAQFGPGSFGCHEAMHMAHVCGELVDKRLCEHPSVLAHPEWKALAERASEALHDLYQAIGEVHMGAPAAAPAVLGGLGPWAYGLPLRMVRVLEEAKREGWVEHLSADAVRAKGRRFWSRIPGSGNTSLDLLEKALGGWG